jgi:hypothetical protein
VTSAWETTPNGVTRSTRAFAEFTQTAPRNVDSRIMPDHEDVSSQYLTIRAINLACIEQINARASDPYRAHLPK